MKKLEGGRVMNVTKTLLQPFFFFFFFFYGSTALVGLGRFSSSLIYTQSVGLIGRGNQPFARPLPIHIGQQTLEGEISPSQGRYLYT
jgi:hypothetical protein